MVTAFDLYGCLAAGPTTTWTADTLRFNSAETLIFSFFFCETAAPIQPTVLHVNSIVWALFYVPFTFLFLFHGYSKPRSSSPKTTYIEVLSTKASLPRVLDSINLSMNLQAKICNHVRDTKLQ